LAWRSFQACTPSPQVGYERHTKKAYSIQCAEIKKGNEASNIPTAASGRKHFFLNATMPVATAEIASKVIPASAALGLDVSGDINRVKKVAVPNSTDVRAQTLSSLSMPQV
jgi:hypothetical protein